MASRKRSSTRLADARARMYHDLIFECAEGVFGRKGYDGATMQEIADEAGVSLKTLYATYESKRDLYEEIMRQRAGEFVATTRVAIDADGGPLERIEHAVAAYVGFLFEHEDWLRIHLRTRVSWAFRPSEEGTAEAWREGHEAYQRVLREGMKSGLFHQEDPEELAILLQMIMQVHVARAVERREEDPAAVVAAVMVHIRRLLCA